MNGKQTAVAARRLDNQRRVHLVDVEAVRRALLGDPAALTELEQGAVVALADLDGFDYTLTARGLGVSPRTLSDRVRARRRRVPALTRDLWAAVMLPAAQALVRAVRLDDADAVAAILTPLDRQRLAALAVVLADLVAVDPDPLDDRDTDPTRFTAA